MSFGWYFSNFDWTFWRNDIAPPWSAEELSPCSLCFFSRWRCRKRSTQRLDILKSSGITKDSRRYWAASRIIAQLISIPWFSAVSVHSDTLCSSSFSECNQINCVLSDFDLAHTINYLLKEKCKSMRAPALRIQPRTYSLIKNRCGLTYSAKKRKYAEQMCVFL